MTQKVSSKPLFAQLHGRGAAASFAKKLNISEGRLSNWRRRGIPSAMVPAVAKAMGISTDDYYKLTQSNFASESKIKQKAIHDSPGDKLLVLLRAFLDTDDEGQEQLVSLAEAVGEHGNAASASGSRTKRR